MVSNLVVVYIDRNVPIFLVKIVAELAGQEPPPALQKKIAENICSIASPPFMENKSVKQFFFRNPLRKEKYFHLLPYTLISASAIGFLL